MAAKDWNKALELRGKSFMRNLETYKMLTRLKPPATINEQGTGKVGTHFSTSLSVYDSSVY